MASLWAFAPATNGNLYVWDGSQLQWSDHGNGGSSGLVDIAAVSHRGVKDLKRHLVVVGTDYNGVLYLNEWDGSQWQWHGMGTPRAGIAMGAPTLLTFEDSIRGNEALPKRRVVFAFASGDDGDLYAAYWDEKQHWKWGTSPWVHIGAPPNISLRHATPSAVTFKNADGVRTVRVFATGSDGHIYDDSWDGMAWGSWIDHGKAPAKPPVPPKVGPRPKPKPQPRVGIASDPSAITYFDRDLDTDCIHIFAITDDHRLSELSWIGSDWEWVDLGQPASGVAISNLSPIALTYHDVRAASEGGVSGTQRLDVFVVGSDGHLHLKAWDGLRWSWLDLGTPPDGPLSTSNPPTAVSYASGAVQQTDVFVKGVTGTLMLLSWNGLEWTWSNQSSGPDGINRGVACLAALPSYAFRLDGFHVDLIRAAVAQHDTDVVGIALEVDGRPIGRVNSPIGDVGPGDYPVGSLVLVPEDTRWGSRVTFSYLIANTAYQDFTGQVKDQFDLASKMFADAVNNYAFGLGTYIDSFVQKLHSIEFANCDGVVAAGGVSHTIAQLDRWTAATGGYSESRRYPGADQELMLALDPGQPPVGCQASDYTVTWSLIRIE